MTDQQIIGIYKIDHANQKWIVGEEELPVQNAFKGHVHKTNGDFDWAYNHNRMISYDSEFFISFDLPERVKQSSNDVRI